MQRFLNGVSVYPGDANNKHLGTSTHKGSSKFCNWYKSTDHQSTSSVALFEVQQRTESITNTNEVYSTDKSVVKCPNDITMKDQVLKGFRKKCFYERKLAP